MNWVTIMDIGLWNCLHSIFYHKFRNTGVSSVYVRNSFWRIQRMRSRVFKKHFWCTMQHVGSEFLHQGSNPCPLLWKQGILTTEPPRKSPKAAFMVIYHILGEGNGTPLQYSSLENPMDRGAWWATVYWVVKSRTWLSDFTFTFHFHASEKEMATHSSVLAWRIPGTGEPGGLPSMGSHRVGHDWSDLAATIFLSSSPKHAFRMKFMPGIF